MCEIALVNPDDVSAQQLHQLAATLHEEQGDGLGILAIQTDGEAFEYETYRKAEPDWFQFHKFYQRTKDDTWRYVVHARAKTAGSVCNANTHPLPVDCPECDSEYVIHNGSVRNHQETRASLISHGHEFESNVDSEVIGHKVSEFPDSVDDHDYQTYQLTGNLNYFVFFDDGILVKLTNKYYVNNENFTVACRPRYRKEPINGSLKDEEWSNTVRWIRVTPDKEIETKSTATSRNRSRSTSSTSGSPYNSSSESSSSSSESTANKSPDGDILAKTYEDLVPRLENVMAAKVAPGVVMVHDEQTGDEEYIFRRDEPAMYYYYAGAEEHVDEEMLQLHKLFDDEGALRPADDVFEENDITPEQVLEILNKDPAEVAARREADQSTLDEIQAAREGELIDGQVVDGGEDFR